MPKRSSRLKTAGQVYHNFKLIKLLPIPELNCTLKEIEHLPSGAQIVQIENDDPENLFCLSFRTLPETSDGVAHILEHTVLCGSAKFPVKDPFFSMTRRSLNTFMNALTGSDFTCYPAASQVPKDFYNLLDVYLDAVFRPNIDELSFMQEGHRLEFLRPKDPESPLEFKGVVFNEMKGALASSTTRLLEALNAALFPDVPYGCNAGGDPKVIPQLSYQELRDFHARYYHPSHCLFFFYGNLPLEEHLDFISEHAFKDVKKVDPLPPIPEQPRFTEPKYLQLTYPASQEEMLEDNALIGFGWLTCHILDQEDRLALSTLEIILLDSDASPLKKALLQSGLCKQVIAYSDTEDNEIPVMIVLKGCKASDAQALEQVIRDACQELIIEGIAQEKINNAVHQLEFYRSEITGDQSPFGLSLFFRSALLKQHGGRLEEGLRIHSIFDAFQKKVVEDPGYLPSLIQRYFLENTHFVRITMIPDENLAKKEAQEEREVLDEIKRQMSPEKVQEIIEKTIALEQFQKDPEDENIDVLPKVGLEDVPKQGRYYPLERKKIDNLDVFSHTCFTNNILYTDLVFDLPYLKEEELSYVRLFTVLLSQIGSGGRSYIENLEYIQAHTGGISAGLNFNLQAKDCHKLHPTIALRGKALYRKASYLFQLLQDMVADADFSDVDRLKGLLLKHYTSLQTSLNTSGLKYAVNLSASGLSISSKLANDWYGLPYYNKIREIAQDFDAHADQLLNVLASLKGKLLCIEKPHLILGCDPVFHDEIVAKKFWGLSDLQTHSVSSWKSNYPLQTVPFQGRVISSPVAFIGKVFNTVSYVHPDAPALNLAAFLFDNLVLHSRIREQGGAYGAGAVSNVLSGNFYFYSYRDPNIASSLEAFKEAIKVVSEGDFDEADLEEAKLEMIQSLDDPVSPGGRADVAYGWWREGKTQKVRQAFRERIIKLTQEEITEAVKTHIVPRYDEGAVVVFAGRELLEKENALLPQPLPILTI